MNRFLVAGTAKIDMAEQKVQFMYSSSLELPYIGRQHGDNLVKNPMYIDNGEFIAVLVNKDSTVNEGDLLLWRNHEGHVIKESLVKKSDKTARKGVYDNHKEYFLLTI